jgi:hypothetical protein
MRNCKVVVMVTIITMMFAVCLPAVRRIQQKKTR